jgi:UDP-N-acetylglucosamine transferase subunit ALG13
MIFATVGTQLPFDRLLSGLESWAMHNPDVPVLAQTGASKRGFDHIKTVSHLSQSDFRKHFEAASLIVAHAGMGTILSASELGKPIILMPRLAKFGEHRNDHQVDTANEMVRLSNVTVVDDVEALYSAIDVQISRGFEIDLLCKTEEASELDPLIDVIRDFIWADPKSASTPALQVARPRS